MGWEFLQRSKCIRLTALLILWRTRLHSSLNSLVVFIAMQKCKEKKKDRTTPSLWFLALADPCKPSNTVCLPLYPNIRQTCPTGSWRLCHSHTTSQYGKQALVSFRVAGVVNPLLGCVILFFSCLKFFILARQQGYYVSGLLWLLDSIFQASVSHVTA